jgi:hypothetical protein
VAALGAFISPRRARDSALKRSACPAAAAVRAVAPPGMLRPGAAGAGGRDVEARRWGGTEAARPVDWGEDSEEGVAPVGDVPGGVGARGIAAAGPAAARAAAAAVAGAPGAEIGTELGDVDAEGPCGVLGDGVGAGLTAPVVGPGTVALGGGVPVVAGVAGAGVPPAAGVVGAAVPASVAGASAPVPPARGAPPAAAGESAAWPAVAGSAWPVVPGVAWPRVPGTAWAVVPGVAWPVVPGTAWAASPSGPGGVGGVGGPGTTRVAAPTALAAAGRARTGVARGTWPTGGIGGETCCTRAAAPAVTRCSSSAARSGARPAHSRRRLSSRACEKNSNARIAIPTSAANAAIAPILVNELESESASGKAVMNPGSV